jgi:hypothetical protein
MASDIGFGTTVSVNDGTSGAMVAFTRVTQVSVPSEDQEQVEDTHLLSTDRIRTYVDGLITPGEFSFTQRYDKDAMTRAKALRGVSKSYEIEMADGSTFTFTGKLKKSEQEISNDAIMDIKHMVQINSAVTWVEGA